jgi:type II secretory pathway pseudopilin PulG
MQSARARLFAFTLLEVLAAVAILALVYTVLARVGIQGFRAEGGSDRRLRASLLADQVLAEIEEQLGAGSAPPLGEKDATREDYQIHLRVTPSEIEIPPRSDAATQRIQAATAKQPNRGATAGGKPGAAGPTQSFFLPAAPGEPPPGRRIEVRVSWIDGATESAVIRETYGLDQKAADSLLKTLESAAKAEKEAAPAQGGQPVGQPAGQPASPPAGNPGMGIGPTP